MVGGESAVITARIGTKNTGSVECECRDLLHHYAREAISEYIHGEGSMRSLQCVIT